MTTNLLSRIVRLEDRQAPPTVVEIELSPGVRLLHLLLAVHAGDLQPHEAVAEGVARATDYGTAAEMHATMRAEGTAFIEWNSRIGTAIEALLATRRSGRSVGEANEAAIRALIADLPEAFRSHPAVDNDDHAIERANTWVSL